MVLTKANPTMWPIKKEVLASARTTQNEQSSHTQYNHSVATPHYFHRIQGAVFLTVLHPLRCQLTHPRYHVDVETLLALRFVFVLPSGLQPLRIDKRNITKSAAVR
jgi:hypothetical protein